MSATVSPELDTPTADDTPAARVRGAIPLTVPLHQVHASPRNARVVHPADLTTLKEHMQRHGQLTRCLVRPMPCPPGGDPTVAHYELAAGHRRRAAAELLGWETIDIDVREMDDHAFVMSLWSENLQRNDVPPLEEARGIAELQRSGWDLVTVALEIGRSEAYVRGRLALLQLSEAAQEAMTRGYLPLSHATEIAKLPAHVQNDVLEEEFALDCAKLEQAAEARAEGMPWPPTTDAAPDGPTSADADADEDQDDEQFQRGRTQHDPFGTAWQPTIPPLAVLRDALRSQYYRRLKVVPWPLEDASVLPHAGACTTCEKRSGAAPSLFPELENIRGEACLDGKCYGAKWGAWERREAMLAAGVDVQVDPTDNTPAPYAELAREQEATDYSSERQRAAEEWEKAEERRKQRELREKAKAQRRIAVVSHARAEAVRRLFAKIALGDAEVAVGSLLRDLLRLVLVPLVDYAHVEDERLLELLSIERDDASPGWLAASEELEQWAGEEARTADDLMRALLAVAMWEETSARLEGRRPVPSNPEQLFGLAKVLGVAAPIVTEVLVAEAEQKERELEEAEAAAKRAAKAAKKRKGAKGSSKAARKSSGKKGPALMTDRPAEPAGPEDYPREAASGSMLDGENAPYDDELDADEE